MAQDFLEPSFIDAGVELRRIPIPSSMITRTEALFGFDAQERPIRLIDGYTIGTTHESVCFSAGLKPKQATILKVKSRWMMNNAIAGDSFNLSYQRLVDVAETPWATVTVTGPVWKEVELTLPLDSMIEGQDVLFNIIITGANFAAGTDLIYLLDSSTGAVRGAWL
jgi:hypothetical protein